jgi:hypothetical protein
LGTYSINIKDEIINLNKELSEIIDTVIYIPLETNKECLIGRIDKIIQHNNVFYICDRITNTLFLFDKNGKFKSKYNKIGRGPYEYLSLEDIDVDLDGFCYLLDNGKIIVLEPDLNGSKEIKLSTRSHRLAVFNDMYAVTGIHFRHDELFLFSKRGAKISSFFPYSGIPRSVQLKPLIKTEDKLLFIPDEIDSVFSIKPNSVDLHADINFEKGIPKDFLKTSKSEISSGFMIPDIYMHGIQGYCETSDFITFRFSYYYQGYDGPFYVLYSKKNNKVNIYTNEIKNNCYLSRYPPLFIDVTETGEFIATINASWFINAFENKKAQLNIVEELGPFSNMSNPIIALIKFQQEKNEK